MLYLPADEYSSLPKIIAIDPGSETLGVSFLEFHPMSLEVQSVSAKTFVGSKLPGMDPWLAAIYGERYARLQAHKSNLIALFEHHNPAVIACESPFYNPRRPNAYGVLVETIAMIKEAVRLYDIWKNPFLIDPPTAKRSVNAKGNADKDVMRAAVLALPEFQGKWCEDPLLYDEHSIDAIAVGYCQLRTLRNY